MNNDQLLQARNLQIHFFTDEGVVRAVDGVDLSIKRGRTLCLVGESGCGKSVAARAFLQIIRTPGRIVAGQILFRRQDGSEVDIAALNPKGAEIRAIRGKDIAMIFQEPMTSLSMMHTTGEQIIENILLHYPQSKPEARAKAIESLRQVGIPRPERLVDEYPFRLSGGMRQRAMIAMALSCNPELLIADEPTTALDVTTQAQIIDLMLELQSSRNMAILFITHDLSVVAEIADEVAVMYLGRVVECADGDTIFNSPLHPYTRALLRSIPQLTHSVARLDVIRGGVPNPFRRPSGCRFHPRCDHMMPGRCDVAEPELLTSADGHQVACFLYSDAATTDVKEQQAGEVSSYA